MLLNYIMRIKFNKISKSNNNDLDFKYPMLNQWYNTTPFEYHIKCYIPNEINISNQHVKMIGKLIGYLNLPIESVRDIVTTIPNNKNYAKVYKLNDFAGSQIIIFPNGEVDYIQHGSGIFILGWYKGTA